MQVATDLGIWRSLERNMFLLNGHFAARGVFAFANMRDGGEQLYLSSLG